MRRGPKGPTGNIGPQGIMGDNAWLNEEVVLGNTLISGGNINTSLIDTSVLPIKSTTYSMTDALNLK